MMSQNGSHFSVPIQGPLSVACGCFFGQRCVGRLLPQFATLSFGHVQICQYLTNQQRRHRHAQTLFAFADDAGERSAALSTSPCGAAWRRRQNRCVTGATHFFALLCRDHTAAEVSPGNRWALDTALRVHSCVGFWISASSPSVADATHAGTASCPRSWDASPPSWPPCPRCANRQWVASSSDMSLQAQTGRKSSCCCEPLPCSFASARYSLNPLLPFAHGGTPQCYLRPPVADVCIVVHGSAPIERRARRFLSLVLSNGIRHTSVSSTPHSWVLS